MGENVMANKTMEDLDLVVGGFNAIREGMCPTIVGHMAHVPILVGLVKIRHKDITIMPHLTTTLGGQLIIVNVIDWLGVIQVV